MTMLTKNYQTASYQKLMQIINKYAADGIIDLDKRLKEQPDFQIYRLEDMVDGTGGIFPACRQTAYSITLVHKGIGEQKIGQDTFKIEDYTLMIVPSRTM